MQHGGPFAAPHASIARLVQRPRAERPARDQEHAALRRQAEPPARLALGDRAGPRHRSPDHAVLPSAAPGRRGTRETPAARTARPAGSRARGARPPRTAQPESASATPRRPSVPPRTRRRRSTTLGRRCVRIRAHASGARPASNTARRLRDARAPRQPGDAKRVERIAGLRDEPRLDAVRRAGEAHAHAAGAERLRDCERRQRRGRPFPPPRSRT